MEQKRFTGCLTFPVDISGTDILETNNLELIQLIFFTSDIQYTTSLKWSEWLTYNMNILINLVYNLFIYL